MITFYAAKPTVGIDTLTNGVIRLIALGTTLSKLSAPLYHHIAPTMGINQYPSLKVITTKDVPAKFSLAKMALFDSDAPTTTTAPSVSE